MISPSTTESCINSMPTFTWWSFPFPCRLERNCCGRVHMPNRWYAPICCELGQVNAFSTQLHGRHHWWIGRSVASRPTKMLLLSWKPNYTSHRSFQMLPCSHCWALPSTCTVLWPPGRPAELCLSCWGQLSHVHRNFSPWFPLLQFDPPFFDSANNGLSSVARLNSTDQLGSWDQHPRSVLPVAFSCTNFLQRRPHCDSMIPRMNRGTDFPIQSLEPNSPSNERGCSQKFDPQQSEWCLGFHFTLLLNVTPPQKVLSQTLNSHSQCSTKTCLMGLLKELLVTFFKRNVLKMVRVPRFTANSNTTWLGPATRHLDLLDVFQIDRGNLRVMIKYTTSLTTKLMWWKRLMLFLQMSNPRVIKPYCMCLRTMKLWSRWSLKAEVLRWDMFPRLTDCSWLFDRINLDSKVQIKYVDTKKPTRRYPNQRGISHVMSEIICWVCLTSAILALQLAPLQWQNEFNKDQQKNMTAKSWPVMNLTARMPSFVSSSTSSNPGRTCYEYQDPGKSVPSDDRSEKPEKPSPPSYSKKKKKRLWSILVFSRVEKWSCGARSIRETWDKFLGYIAKSWPSSWRTSSGRKCAFRKVRRDDSRWTGETWDSGSPRRGAFRKFRHAQWRSRICGQSQRQRLSLIGDETVINLQSTKVYVFSDSVLCLGRVLQHPVPAKLGKTELRGSNPGKATEIMMLSMENRLSSGTSFQDSQRCSSAVKFTDPLSDLGQTPETFTINDISCDRKGNKDECLANAGVVKVLARRFGVGQWSFIGSRSEKKWCSAENSPQGAWDNIAEQMLLEFAESGHPIFRATTPLSRGILKSKGRGKLSIHFAADVDNWFNLSHYSFCQSAQCPRSSGGYMWRIWEPSGWIGRTWDFDGLINCSRRNQRRSSFPKRRLHEWSNFMTAVNSTNWIAFTRKFIEKILQGSRIYTCCLSWTIFRDQGHW